MVTQLASLIPLLTFIVLGVISGVCFWKEESNSRRLSHETLRFFNEQAVIMENRERLLKSLQKRMMNRKNHILSI